jgi:hypothetical protein
MNKSLQINHKIDSLNAFSIDFDLIIRKHLIIGQ